MRKLTRLIHSLERTEKRYFKRYVGLYSDKEQDYMILYDIIENHKDGTRPSVRDKISDLNLKHPQVKANYLYELILDALIDYQRKKNDYFQLQDNIKQIIVLSEKGLTKDALSLIKKSKNKALKQDASPIYLDLLTLENRIQGLKGYDSKWFDELLINHKEVSKIYKKHQRKSAMVGAYVEVQQLVRDKGFLSSEEVNQFLLKYKLLFDDLPAFTGREYLNTSNLLNILFFNQNPTDWDKLAQVAEKQVKFLESADNMLELTEVFTILGNAIITGYINGEDRLFFERIVGSIEPQKAEKKIFRNVKRLVIVQAQISAELLHPKSAPTDFIQEIESSLEIMLNPGIPLQKLNTIEIFVSYCINYYQMKKAYHWFQIMEEQHSKLREAPNNSDKWQLLKVILSLEFEDSSKVNKDLKKLLKMNKNAEESQMNDTSTTSTTSTILEVGNFFSKYNSINKLNLHKSELIELVDILQQEKETLMRNSGFNILIAWINHKFFSVDSH